MLDRFWFALAVQVQYGGSWGTIPKLLFEEKGLILAIQQVLVPYSLWFIVISEKMTEWVCARCTFLEARLRQ
jgi:hypothetical protein